MTAVAEKAHLTPREALIPRAMFERLPTYSTSIPTGTTIGKFWRCNTTHGTPDYSEDGPWLLGCYERVLPPEKPGAPGRRGRNQILIRWRAITIVEAS